MRKPELAGLYTEVGRFDDARTAFRSVTAQGYDDIGPRDQLWLTATAHCAETAAALRDRDAAAAFLEALAPFETHMETTGMTYDGYVGGVLARLNQLVRNQGTAERQFADAIAQYRRLEAPYWIARTLLDHAEFLDESTDASDRTRAESERAEALPIAENYGFAGHARRAG